MSPPTKKPVAVVLAGAVARGAYEAGVLEVIAESNLQIVRIVAASSGALNGAYLAAAVRARRERAGARELIELWRDHASWREIFHLSLGDLVRREGFSDHTKLEALLRRYLKPTDPAVVDRAAVSLAIVVAPLAGVPGTIGSGTGTTYEHVIGFEGDAFDSAAGLEPVFAATLASASFPGLFAPMAVPGLGFCVDGGATNNTPIKYALQRDVEAILVVAPTVTDATLPREPRGLALVAQLAEMLIDERLYRDLHDAETVNDELRGLDALVTGGKLTASQHADVIDALGWQRKRIVDVVQLRPTQPLEGSSFSGFLHPGQRARGIEVGRARAREVLGDRGWWRPG